MMKNVIKYLKKYYSILLLILLIIFHAINNYNWLRLDMQPPLWCDQVGYLTQSLCAYKAVHIFSINQLIHTIFDFMQGTLHPPYSPFIYFLGSAIIGIRPPLVSFLAIPFYSLAGTSPDVAYMSNILYFTILLCSVYGITKRTSNRKIGLLSAFIVSTFPMIFGMSRQFLMDLPLTAMVSLSIYFLLCTDHFKNRAYSILFGISVALGLLTKPSYLFFVLFPFVYIIKNDIKIMKMLLYPKQFLSELKQRKSILNIVFATVIAVSLASIWYIPNLKTIFWLHSVNRGGEGLSLINLQSILFYPLGMINYQISFLYLLTLIILTLFYMINPHQRFKYSIRKSDEIMILILWIIIPYLIFTFYFPVKELRYLLPSTPPIAIVISAMISRINSKYAKGVIIIILLLGSMQFFALTYGTKALPKEIQIKTTMPEPLNKVVLFSQENRCGTYPKFWEVSWTYPPGKENWKISDIIDIISESIAKDTPKVCIISHCERFHSGTFRYYRILHDKRDMLFCHPRYLQFKENIQDYDSVIVKNRNNCDAFHLCDEINKTYDFFLNNSKNFTMIRSLPLPDGSDVSIYIKTDKKGL